MNKYIKLLAFSKELNPFLVLYQALNVLFKDSIKLLFVSLDLTYGQLLSILFNKLHNNFYFQLLCNLLLNNIDFY